MGGKTREVIAEALIASGILEVIGATGACECGSYSLLEYIFCVAIGAALVLKGLKIEKEEEDEEI